MGNSSSTKDTNPVKGKLIAAACPDGKEKKLLCVHGWRTSGDILVRQTAALRYHLNVSAVVVNAPWVAKGPPDEGIALFYPDEPYYEWYDGLREGVPVEPSVVEKSLQRLVEHLEKFGPYDGILGFSQGGSVATMLAKIQQNENKNWFKFMILIGAVEPPENCSPKVEMNIPSLHIIGTADPYEAYCLKLYEQYNRENRQLMRHEEGHNIPSIRTGLYPQIKAWLDGQQ